MRADKEPIPVNDEAKWGKQVNAWIMFRRRQDGKFWPCTSVKQNIKGGRNEATLDQSRDRLRHRSPQNFHFSNLHIHIHSSLPYQSSPLPRNRDLNTGCRRVVHESIETTEMKRSLVTLAAIAASGATFAQSTVTISGSVASAYEQYSVGGDARITGFDASANSVTFSGTEDLGGGLKVAFTLNKRFNTADGSGYNTREFENSFLTLSGGFGALSLGRHQPISVTAYDVFGGLGIRVWNPAGAANAGDYGYNNTAANRYDDAISYTTPDFKGFSATLVTTKSPANTARQSTAVRLAYTSGPLSAAYVRESVAAKNGDVLRTDQNLGLSYDFKVAKALLLWGKDGGADDRISVGVIVPVGSSLKLMAQYRTEGETVSAAGAKSAMPKAWALGAEYALSKRTGVFAHFGDYENSVQSAYRVGLKHSF